MSDTSSPPAEPIRPAGEPVVLAVTTVSVTPRWGPTPNGPELLDEFGENRVVLDAGKRIIILGDAQPGPNGTWVPGYVVPDNRTWPADFVAWIPAAQAGLPTLARIEREGCPGAATIGTVAPLLPADRRRCFGSSELVVDARTGYAGGNPAYDADPLWLGANSDLRRTVSLFDAGPEGRQGGGAFAPNDRAFIDARTPPQVDLPPLGMLVRVTGHLDDPAATTCMRRQNLELGPGQILKPGWGVPPEDPAVSVEWCRDQFVMSSWEVLAGPEGRLIDPANPQLHRSAARQPGVVVACAGVGMPLLTIRIDLSQVDPVWVESGPGQRSVAVFGPEFHLRPDPTRVESTTGVTLVDREVVDPDRGKPGLAVCPGGEVIAFDILGP